MRSALTGRLRTWELKNRAGGEATADLPPRLILTEPEAMTRAALIDLGIAFVAVPHALRISRAAH